jgi:hypothetical protein
MLENVSDVQLFFNNEFKLLWSVLILWNLPVITRFDLGEEDSSYAKKHYFPFQITLAVSKQPDLVREPVRELVCEPVREPVREPVSRSYQGVELVIGVNHTWHHLL